MTPRAHRPPLTGASRRAWGCALALALACAGEARAQVAFTAGVDNVSRYRGTGTGDRGPLLRAGAMADSPFAATRGAYLGLAGQWRLRDAGLVDLDVLAGWSGRFADWPGLQDVSPGWGWDAGLHRRHDGEGARYDFSEAMLGLLAPAGALRAWWSPHYFGGAASSLYVEADAHHALDEHWRLFGHLGSLRYGRRADGTRSGDRLDTRLGIGWTDGAWDLQLARDALVAGHARGELAPGDRHAAWVASASVSF